MQQPPAHGFPFKRFLSKTYFIPASVTQPGETMKKANRIVLIMTDTQRWDMVGCYGNPDMKTPSLDTLAAKGVRFDRAYTCQPVCGPARSAIFTGTWPHFNGVWANNQGLGDNVQTIGRRLKDHGFHTAYIGKWHLDGSDYFGLGKCPDGWDPVYWYDMRNYIEELTPAERVKSRIYETSHEPGMTAEFTFGHRVSNRAIDFLEKHRKEDFILTVSYDEPHQPFLCPEPYNHMYDDYTFPATENVADSLADKPEHHRIWAGKRLGEKNPKTFVQDGHLNSNSFVDSEIGRVLNAIWTHTPDALVIYTSDHGDAFGAHHITNKGPAMYDEVTRIPFIVSWPGVTPGSAATSQPFSHIDLAPTIMAAAGLPVSKAFDGVSALAAFADPKVRVNDAIFMEYGRYETDHDGYGGFQPIRATFDGKYKLVVNLLTSDELYDIENDPHEMKNLILAPGCIAERNRLHDRLLKWMNDTRDPFRGYYWERRPWRTDASKPTWEYTGMTRQRENEEYEPRQLDYDTGIEMTEPVRGKDLRLPRNL